MDTNKFIVKVLSDGRVSITSPGKFGKTQHVAADEFLAVWAELMGGAVESKPLPQNQHTHAHARGEQHHHH